MYKFIYIYIYTVFGYSFIIIKRLGSKTVEYIKLNLINNKYI